MVQLAPVPFEVLVGRMLSELERKRSAFDLPAQRFVKAYPGRDLSIAVHHRRAATPFGPAAGPHTQMAQNIALAWLAGGRTIECKTVQVKDDIEVPRPCIDMETVGYNVEWSQELTVGQSLEEYVKGAMLIEMLKASGVGAGSSETVFDMSVGYDLAGIRSAKVRGFLDGMMDAGKVVERLRAKIPDAYRRFRDLPFPTRISDTLTLSTFHGCPPGEIEAIVEHLVGEIGLDVTVKLNPTLLGREEVDAILHDAMGYHEIKVPDRAFAEDASWDDAAAMVERLGAYAAARGRSFGVKFSNTLVVENHKSFFPASEPLMYLSGPPLHPLAIALVDRFRRTFGDRFPISFAGGVDAANFADTVGLGPDAGDRVQRPVEAQRLPARMGLHRRPRQAHGRGRGEGHRHVHAQGAWPGRGRARQARIAGSAERRLPRRARRRRRSARRGGRSLRRMGLRRARAERRGLRRARDRRSVVTAPPRTRRRRTRSAARSFCSTASPATSASRSAPTTPISSSPSRRERRRSSG